MHYRFSFAILIPIAVLAASCGPESTTVEERSQPLQATAPALAIGNTLVQPSDLVRIEGRTANLPPREEVSITFVDIGDHNAIVNWVGNAKKGLAKPVNVSVFMRQSGRTGLKRPYDLFGCMPGGGPSSGGNTIGNTISNTISNTINLSCAPARKTVNPPGTTASQLVDFKLVNADNSPASTVKAGDILTGKLYLSQPAEAGGVNISIYTSDPGALDLPSSVHVPAGSNVATFPVPVEPTPRATSVTVAVLGKGGFFSSTLDILPHYQGHDLELVSVDDAVMQIEEPESPFMVGTSDPYILHGVDWAATTRVTLRNNGTQALGVEAIECVVDPDKNIVARADVHIFPYYYILQPGDTVTAKVFLKLPSAWSSLADGAAYDLDCSATISEGYVDQEPSNNTRTRSVVFPAPPKPDLRHKLAPTLYDCDHPQTFAPAVTGKYVCVKVRWLNDEGFGLSHYANRMETTCSLTAGSSSVSGINRLDAGWISAGDAGIARVWLLPYSDQLAPGTYKLSCTIDSNNVFSETNEGNNTWTGWVTLNGPPAPVVP